MNMVLLKLKKHVWAYLFVMPMLILFVAFTVYPLLASIRYTFYDWDGIGIPKDFVGLQHYLEITKDGLFWNAFKNTFIYTAVVVSIQTGIALGLAVILNSRFLKLKTFFRAVFFSPIITSTAIVGIVISLLLIGANRNLNDFFQTIGIIENPVDWMGNPTVALWTVIAVGIWIGIGYPLIYFLAGLQSIDNELYDAARIDGAGSIDLLLRITIPLMRPIIIIVVLLSTLHSLRVFDLVQVMTKGGPYFATDVVSTYIYRHAFPSSGVGETESNLGFASAAAFFMGTLIMVITVVQLLVSRQVSIWNKLRADEQ